MKYNVLHVVSRLPVGGVENMLMREIEGYDKSRFKASVCCMKEGGEIADKLKQKGYTVEVLHRMKGHGFDAVLVKELIRLMRRDEIDILRTHQYHANLYGRIAGILAGVKVMVPTFHNLYCSPEKPKLHRRILNRLLAFFTEVMVGVSDAVSADIVRYDLVPNGKVIKIYNGIVLSEYNLDLSKEEARKLLDLPTDCVIIGTVGRLTRQKGHRYLIEAAAGLLQKACLVIAGDGPLRDELEALASDSALRCIFLGNVSSEKIPLFLRSLDIFCFPSLWEGLGVAVIEAMASGLPVVATDIAPLREVLGTEGVYTPPANAEDIACELNRLMAEPLLIRTLGEKLRERAALFSIENTVNSYEQLFVEMLEKKAAR